MKTTVWKRTAISAMALLMLTTGAASAFADGGRGNYDNGKKGNGWHDDDRDRDRDHDDDDDKDKEIKITWKFEDEEDLDWALEYIMRLASKGVFTGYEDGTFKPQQKISRIETITAAVRLMGLREQAESAEEMSTELQFKDANKLEKKYPWAVGYVAVALENDLFAETETEIKPEQNATRLWSTVLLVKALKLEDEAKKLNNTKLDFKDADQIPAGSVGYVALALQKGIITGYEDKHGNKTFRPNQPVTRAELAALLDRTDSEMPDHDAQAITGTLKAAPVNGQLTLVKPDNTELTLTVDPTVFIFRDNQKVAVSALQAGDKLFLRTYQNKVVFIEVTEKAPVNVSFSELGVVNTLTFNAQAKLATVSITKEVNSQTTVLIYNVDPSVAIVGDVSKLKSGQLVQLSGVNNVVKTIEIK
ncbi:S-layer homology domain-containing protein [Paenibacillus nanensis]|uniref:S-layer homology domain-containing protein n=1 Tax=Paenibacillus nanensis TaxID=393251 RepID=A0A3A1UWN2_9BACL|nr:S-layer homology domain-containing protein [Paenibacillus nanensis]RIX52605.1 S-layer homology domain-containing protein [Paenibacillus nanensis]